MNPALLIIDDDEFIRTQMHWALAAEYDVSLAGDRAEALDKTHRAHPILVLLDLGLPPSPHSPVEGLALLSELLAIDRFLKIIVITGQAEKEVALQAVGLGACDFLCKPVDADELRVLLRRHVFMAGIEREYREQQTSIPNRDFEGMLGQSAAIRSVFGSIQKVAATDAPVLILGESGTGKEMVARAIHLRSDRKQGPFVAINCSAIPETLLESELFGHEKGTFTGAHVQRKGHLESAQGGTLFLDEIGEIPLGVQVKLLRFLQEQKIARVGGREELPIDVRVIAATNADLRAALSGGAFREDLYYRLAVVQLTLPPLRERGDDLTILAQSFLRRLAGESGRDDLSFDPEALQSILDYRWPGNVRELENRVRRAVIMAEGKRITSRDLELNQVPNAKSVSLKDARQILEREMVQRALNRHRGSITPAAAELGVSRPTLYELMDKLGIART